MKIYQGIQAVEPPIEGVVLVIGNFDGVHRGHQQLIAQAGLFAANTGGSVVAMTFEPHPLAIVAPTKAPERLCDLDERLRLLDRAGADIVVIAKSEPSLLGLEAEEFVEKVIKNRLSPTHIVEGPSFGFGRNRTGTPELLAKLAGRFGCDVHILDPVRVQIDERESMLVSSSLIRQLVRDGKVRRAALCLGRPYSMLGIVAKGEQRGASLGFPTANLTGVDQLVPADGVYSGTARVKGKTHLCAISIGSKETFQSASRCIEAHLLDFQGDIYDCKIRIEFGTLIRKQQAFSSPEELILQVKRDVEFVRHEGAGYHATHHATESDE